ncbi:SH3 domain-containing protein [Ensifer sp. BR816]|uniref:SH3 domain-containing protein n=1 Tax=Rhizobium sp. (strain BR816) TaxID=1057002 RepID=UPI0012F8B593|nr:SH3 domain-containing protein [Ensifer sp. BR816]
MLMRDETFSELLDEINAKSGQVRMSSALCWAPLVLGALAGLASGGPGLLLAALALPGWAMGRWFDSYRRSTVLYYDLEGDAEAAYKQLAEGFDGLRQCAGKWHIEAGGAITSLTAWKRNAGASHLVKKKPTSLTYALPSVIKSNISPPALSVGRQILYFMPDVVFVQDGNRMGAVNYRGLNIRWQDSRFIEDGRVPSDARIVDHTWKHPNKSGGPDRRFKDNRQIPICLYETMHFQSNSGVNELVEFSQPGRTAAFARGCQLIAQLPKEKAPSLAVSPPSQSAPQTQVEPEQGGKPRSLGTVALAVLAIFVGLPLFAVFVPSQEQSTPTASSSGTEQAISGPATTAAQDPTVQSRAISTAPANLHDPTTDPSATLPLEGQTTPSWSSVEKDVQIPRVPSTASAETARQPSWHTRTTVNLRKGPGTKYLVLSVVQKDSAVVLLEQRGGWSRVKVHDDVIGWMTSKAIAADNPKRDNEFSRRENEW